MRTGEDISKAKASYDSISIKSEVEGLPPGYIQGGEIRIDTTNLDCFISPIICNIYGQRVEVKQETNIKSMHWIVPMISGYFYCIYLDNNGAFHIDINSPQLKASQYGKYHPYINARYIAKILISGTQPIAISNISDDIESFSCFNSTPIKMSNNNIGWNWDKLGTGYNDGRLAGLFFQNHATQGNSIDLRAGTGNSTKPYGTLYQDLNIFRVRSNTTVDSLATYWMQASNEGSVYAATKVIMQVLNYTTKLFELMGNGNLALGALTPANRLHLDSGTANYSYLQFTAGVTTGQTATDGSLFGIDASGNLVIAQQENLPIIFYTNATERVRILSGGNVGIGTSGPAQKLDVRANGTANIYDGQVQIYDTQSVAQGIGGRIKFGSTWKADGTTNGDLGFIGIAKENALDEYGFSLVFGSRANGSSPTEKARITGTGKFLVGSVNSYQIGDTTSAIQIHGIDASTGSLSITRWQNGVNPSRLTLGLARGGVGTYTIVQDNDDIGRIDFAVCDGTDLASIGASIRCKVSGTPGANDVPCELIFSTTADGAATPTDRYSIDSSGWLRASTASNRRYYHLPFTNSNPGSSGVTWVPVATTGNQPGWRATTSSHTINFNADVHADWDGASDLTVEVYFLNGAAGALAGDTIDLRLNCYYSASGDTAYKTQAVEVATTIGAVAAYKMFKATFTINWDQAGNIVEAGDLISFLLNLETDSSEIANVIFVQGNFYYNTTHVCIESGDV